MRCTIIGAARSGVAAAVLAQRLGYHVFVSERGSAQQFAAARKLFERNGIEYEFGGHSERALEAELLIVSPGVPPTAPILQAATAHGIPTIGELEFASRYARAPIIAITGTNGKTTTTALTAHILQHAGYDAVACGNIGLALSEVVARDLDVLPERRIYVVEASSYQLAFTTDFHPRVAVILNITPDHLAYHGSFENYVRAKWRIFRNQTEGDVLILCADDPYAAGASEEARATVQMFSLYPVTNGIYARTSDRSLVLCSNRTEVQLMRYDSLPLRGVHNLYNSMAAILAARAFEISNEDLRDSLLSFAGVEHRLEPVRIRRGVEYINDSKATNVNATWYALQAFEQPIVLLMGGRGDGNDYSLLDELVRARCRCIVCYGEEASAIFNHFCSIVRCYRTTTLEEAVAVAAEVAQTGDIVLLSPACKSFDQFLNFEDRGNRFKELVHQLPE